MGLSPSTAPNRNPVRVPIVLLVFAFLFSLAPGAVAAIDSPIQQASFAQASFAQASFAQASFAQSPGAGSSVTPANSSAPRAYTLPPDKLQKAIHLARSNNFLHFGNAIWGILFLLLWLGFRGNAALRAFSASLTPKRYLQGLIYLPLLLLVLTLSSLPFDIYSQHVQLNYGLSVQGWGSWFGDWAKATALSVVLLTPALLALYWLIRKSARLWWLYFWLACLPGIVLLVFVTPVLIAPLFNDFSPLAQSNQPLVDQLERVVARTGTDIPPERIFLMKASDKVTGLNAYVTGIGASKRVIVWDTTIAKASVEEILFIFGHESGHYVLNHIYKGIAFASLILLLFLWIGYQLIHRIILIYGPGWRVPNLGDWSSVAVLILLFSILSLISEPVQNSFSRMLEHEADVYGQEAVHGIVADPQRVAQDAFQRLGEIGLDEPDPSPFIVFWTYSHPTIADRFEFAGSYNPWVAGQQPKYFKKD